MAINIAVLSPHSPRTGSTVTSILLAMALAETKRRVFLTHVDSTSLAFQTYMGINNVNDKTSTSTQLVKLMREGALKSDDVGDYCHKIEGYLDVFTNFDSLFTVYDMGTMLKYLMEAASPYDYKVVDVDLDLDTENAKLVVNQSKIIVLNLTPDFAELKQFKAWLQDNQRLLKGKSLLLFCNRYDPISLKKIKTVTDFLGVKTPLYVARENGWVRWGCNNSKLPLVFVNGRNKNGYVFDLFKSYTALASAVVKLRNRLLKSSGGA